MAKLVIRWGPGLVIYLFVSRPAPVLSAAFVRFSGTAAIASAHAEPGVHGN